MYKSCFKSCQMIKDLTSHENLKTILNYNLVISLLPKMKVLPVLVKTYIKLDTDIFS